MIPLQIVLVRVTSFERHETSTGYLRSVALKVFFAQAVNTGVIFLLVNVQTPYNNVPTGIGILHGAFPSFNNRWPSGKGLAVLLCSCRKPDVCTCVCLQWWEHRWSSR